MTLVHWTVQREKCFRRTVAVLVFFVYNRECFCFFFQLAAGYGIRLRKG